MGSYPPPPPSGNDWGKAAREQGKAAREQAKAQREQFRAQRDMARAQRDAYRDRIRGQRRSSIVGPLLLIGLGVCFLLVQTGHLSARYLWVWYARFWPLLLVGAGVIMLLEWAFDHYVQSDPDHPRYSRRLGGGVFVLLLLLGISGIVFSSMHQNGRDFIVHGLNLNQDNLDEFLGNKHESDQTIVQPLPTGASFTINNPRGDIILSGTSDDGQIHIAAHKEIFTRTDSEAGDRAERLTPAFNTSGSNVAVTLPTIEGARADLTVTIPPSGATTITPNHGDVRMRGIKAPVNVTANHGDITLSAITGDISARINNSDSSVSAHSITGQATITGRGHDTTLSDVNGSVTLDGDFFGNIHFERIRGPIKFHTSRTDLQLARLDGELDIDPDISLTEAVGPLTINTGNRNISLERVAGDISVNNRNGAVDLTNAPPLGNVTIQNHNGSVDMTVPHQAGFTVHAEAADGDADNDFSLATTGNDDRKVFSGTVGKGGPSVHISTSHGDIALKKASIAPLPPTPPTPPPLSIRDPDGSSVIINQNGVNISGSDGNTVSIGKDGVNIHTSPDGGKVYTAKDGTRLITTPDGTTTYTRNDGTRFVSAPDGTKSYSGADGTRITITPDGNKVGIGPDNKALSDSEIDKHIRQLQDEVRTAARQTKH